MRTSSSLALALALALSFLVSQASFGSPTVAQTFAGCESSAYAAIGVQTDNAASVEYLERKNELVRVCMIQHGFSFKSSAPDGAWMEISTNAYKKHGVSKTPQYLIPKEVQAAVDRDIRGGRAVLSLRSSNWVK